MRVNMLPVKFSAMFLTYLVAITLLSAWVLINNIAITEQTDSRLLSLPETPVFNQVAFVSAQHVAAYWQIPAEVLENPEQPENTTSAVRDQFEYMGKQYQLLGIFDAVTPFAVLNVLDAKQPDTNINAQQVKLHDEINAFRVASMGKYQVCLAYADLQHCLYLFKSDIKLSKAQ